MQRYPRIAAAIARPVPVLPLVGSTIVPPGLSRPWRSAASSIATAGRSLTLPPGIDVLDLCKHETRRAVDDLVELDKRGVADRFERVFAIDEAGRSGRTGRVACHRSGGFGAPKKFAYESARRHALLAIALLLVATPGCNNDALPPASRIRKP